MPIGIVLVMILFIPTGIRIYHYLKSTFRLVEDVERLAPEVWESLGRPRRVYVRTAKGGSHTIQPMLPWLGWIWGGDPGAVPHEVAGQYHRTRTLLLRGLTLFSVCFVIFLVSFAQAA
jgi:hypothetical protein